MIGYPIYWLFVCGDSETPDTLVNSCIDFNLIQTWRMMLRRKGVVGTRILTTYRYDQQFYHLN